MLKKCVCVFSMIIVSVSASATSLFTVNESLLTGNSEGGDRIVVLKSQELDVNSTVSWDYGTLFTTEFICKDKFWAQINLSTTLIPTGGLNVHNFDVYFKQASCKPQPQSISNEKQQQWKLTFGPCSCGSIGEVTLAIKSR